MTAIKNEIVLHGLKEYNQMIDRVIEELNLQENADLCFDIRLILVEALTNAYKHGNEGDDTKPITLRFSYRDDKIVFEVQDSGKGFENVIIPEYFSDSELLNNCGRGLFLISCVADHIEFKQNVVIIEKHILSKERG